MTNEEWLIPVAWMSPGKERLEFSTKSTVYGSHTIPLYTAPPSKPWVSLTDEEIGTAICNADYIYLRTCEDIQYVVFLAKVIEAKLKEKNQ